MFAITNGSLRSACLLAGCFVFLLGCPPSKPPETPGVATGGGPGGDDDRPITMEGASFVVKWAPKNGAPDNGFDMDDGLYKHSKNGASNWIECDFGGVFELKRKAGKALIVTLQFASGDFEFLQAITKKNGKDLSIALVREFDDSVANQLLHPDQTVKVKQVVLNNVQLSNGSLPGNCTQTGDKIACDTSAVAGPKVKIHVCNGGGCRAPVN